MFSHGIIAGLLFAIVGRIVYDRTHTRQLAELETMHLSKRLPFAAWAFVVAGIASMGCPASRFCGGVPGVSRRMDRQAVVDIGGGVGIVVGVAYTWRATQKAFFSDKLPTPEEHPKTGWPSFAAITWPEATGVALLAGVSLFVGLYRGYCSMQLNRR